ncbi:MAG: M28 family peptidase [Planctomycetes bacterium]|nr:M28 family peptidase [Planctomycetota bacterium]
MLSAAFLFLATQGAPAQNWAEHPALSSDTLSADLHFLAADEMLGRRTGEMGARVAGEWIRSRFLRAGLQKMGDSWYQEFPSEPVHLDAQGTYVMVGDKRLDAGADFLPHPTSPNGSVSGEAVFVGWGIHAPERGYSDFDGVDLEGKIAVLFRWEPGASDSDHIWEGRRMLPQSTLAKKVQACAERGAIAVLAATPPDPMQKARAVGAPFWPAHSQMWEMLNGPAIASMMPADELAATNFSTEDAVGQMFTIMQNSVPLGAEIPMGYVSPRVMRALLRKIGTETVEWVENNAGSMEPNSFVLPLEGVSVHVKTKPVNIVGRNYIGVMPGSDPKLAQEYVLVGAHYDHVGFNESGEIWNGADDNGSGTVSLLAMLDAISSLPIEKKPKRSIIFVAFSGEELGLIGSYQFLAGGFVDPEKIVGMVNMDMVGRSAENSVYVVGTKSGKGLANLVRTQGKSVGLRLRFDNEEFFDRSDQVGFYYSGIPIVFFNTEEHDDYHTPRDTPDLIHYDDMAKICAVATGTILELANQMNRVQFVDAYDLIQPVYGQSAQLMIPFPVEWVDRLDY